jgi:DNA-binding transcriptional LysR family regulator
MVPFAGAANEEGAPVSRADALDRACLFHRCDGPVDGGHPDARRFGAGGSDQIFDGEGRAQAVSGRGDRAAPVSHPTAAKVRIIITSRHGDMVPPHGTKQTQALSVARSPLRVALHSVGRIGASGDGRSAVNLAQIKAFVMVVDHGSFSAAARAMGISQPAVTMQVQGLEADLGVTLLDRAYRKIELTESGASLLPHARTVLEELESAREDLVRMAESVTGRLSIVASTTPGQYLLPRLLGSFLQENPEVSIALAVADTAQVVEAVAAGEADLGMTGAVVKGARADFEALGTDGIAMICPPGHRFADAKRVSLADAVAEPFIMREEGSGTRQVAEEALREAGVDPDELHVVTELGTSEAIVSAVEGGMGLAMVSSWVACKALELGTVATVPVAEFPVSRPLYVVTPRTTPTRATEAFVGHLRGHVG